MASRDSGEFGSIPDAVLVVGRDGSIVSANEHAERVFGYERGKLVGLTIESLIPERYRKRHARLVEGFFAKPSARPMGTDRELRGLRSDGKEFPVEIAIGPSESGTHTVAVVRDITATVKVRDELRQSEERFRVAAASTADLIWEADMLAETVNWFGDIDGMLGYDPCSFPRTLGAWIELIHPDDLDRVNRLVEHIVETGSDFHARYRVRHRDGTYRHWEDRAKAIGWVDGRGNKIVGAITDISESTVARQKLEHAMTEVETLKDRLQAESQYLAEEIKSDHDFDDIIGDSTAMMVTLHKVESVAGTDSTVLILGETGTGKELLARAIHDRSNRRNRPLVKIDCTTLPPGLVESELFGHQKGAFTGAYESQVGRFELADGGTIFLDEVGELSIDLQAKLLRVIQEGEFQPLGSKRVQKTDVRIMAATNRDLRNEMREGRFRSDLYYRLGVFLIESPPLRERREDIPLLVSYFVAKFGVSVGKSFDSVAQSSMDALMAYDWPGNVRELQNVLERSVVLCPAGVLHIREVFGDSAASSRASEPSLKHDLQNMERSNILRALRDSGWKVKGEDNAASRLGLKPSTLQSRMKTLGIKRP